MNKPTANALWDDLVERFFRAVKTQDPTDAQAFIYSLRNAVKVETEQATTSQLGDVAKDLKSLVEGVMV